MAQTSTDALGPRRRDDPVAAPGEIVLVAHARDLVPRARENVDAIEELSGGRAASAHVTMAHSASSSRPAAASAAKNALIAAARLGWRAPVPDEQLDGTKSGTSGTPPSSACSRRVASV